MFSPGALLREKTQTYLKMKGELAATRAESVVLRRTEQILKGRDEVINCWQADQLIVACNPHRQVKPRCSIVSCYFFCYVYRHFIGNAPPGRGPQGGELFLEKMLKTRVGENATSAVSAD